MPELYNEQGRVKDIEIAHEMARVEYPYRKKLFGIFSLKSEISAGEKKAEKEGLDILRYRSILAKIEKEKERILNFSVGSEYTERESGISLGDPQYSRFRNARFEYDGKKWEVKFCTSSYSNYSIRSIKIDGHRFNHNEMYMFLYAPNSPREKRAAIHRKFSEEIGSHCGVPV